MDKKNVIGSLSNTRKRKPSKKLVDSIRKETFQNAYPDQVAEKKGDDTQNDKEETIAKQVQRTGEEKRADTQINQKVDIEEEDPGTTEEEKPKQSKTTANTVPKKSNRGRKKKELPDGPNEFTTLNCTQVTLNRAKISSALTKTPMYQFVDEAVDHYIKYLKKNGKLNLDL